MKQLLYLNQDYLYSYYAQAFEGLEQTRTKSVTDATLSSEEHLSETVKNTSGVAAQIPQVIKFEGKRETTEDTLNTRFMTLDAAREVATVALHDNALNEVITHSKATTNAEKKLGEYAIETGHFSILDLQYWLDLLSDKTIAFLAEQMWIESIKHLPNPKADAVQKGKKSFIENYKKDLKETRSKIEAIDGFKVFDIALIINNAIVPLKRDYMKESSREIIFKYESQVSVFGRVTRTSSKIQNNSFGAASGLSSSLTDIWLQLLKSMLSYNPSSSIIVIDPIAVYVE